MRNSRLIPALCLIIVGVALLGCSTTAPLYVIDVQKLAGAEPATAESLLHEMVPCKLKYEERWEEGQTDVQDIIGKLNTRRYQIESGQVDQWQRKPTVDLTFDPEYEERVHQIRVSFSEYVDKRVALLWLGYPANNQIKHYYSPDAWYFITRVYLHQIHFEDTGQSTAVTIHFDALTH